MSDKEKLAMLEETFDVDAGTLSADMELDGIEEYDSMTKLSLIVMIEEEFGKKLSGTEIKEFKTVQDILNIMVKG
ncbi:MAG: acyl carrier protein [Lachnospiraceae bacterium]|nr:acyl carrier protein [uncultured Acetatifactor sp.]MCI8288034.1 acyl carrier protein [Lachnospiraceae bacterium]